MLLETIARQTFTYLDIDARSAQLTVVNRCVKCTAPYHIDCDGVLAPDIFIEAVDYIATFWHIESAFILMYLKDRSFVLEGTEIGSCLAKNQHFPAAVCEVHIVNKRSLLGLIQKLHMFH